MSEQDKNRWQRVTRPAEGQAVCFELRATMRLSDGQSVDVPEQGFLICFQGKLRACVTTVRMPVHRWTGFRVSFSAMMVSNSSATPMVPVSNR